MTKQSDPMVKQTKLRPFKIYHDKQADIWVAKDLDTGYASQGETKTKAEANLIEALRLVILTMFNNWPKTLMSKQGEPSKKEKLEYFDQLRWIPNGWPDVSDEEIETIDYDRMKQIRKALCRLIENSDKGLEVEFNPDGWWLRLTGKHGRKASIFIGANHGPIVTEVLKDNLMAKDSPDE